MPAQKKPLTACPLPIATTQLAQGLLRLHSRLRGELAKAADDEELLVPSEAAGAAMAHIEALVGSLASDSSPGRSSPSARAPESARSAMETCVPRFWRPCASAATG